MSRNYGQHPEISPGLAVAEYEPGVNGWKGDARAELKGVNEVVADYCNPAIELGMPCDCIQAHGYSEQLLADPHCPVCGGTGRPTRKTLVAGIDALNGEIDQLASAAGDICTPAKTFLDLAWWHAENAIRQVTGHCSMGRDHKGKDGKGFCACCHRYNELKAKAERAGRML